VHDWQAWMVAALALFIAEMFVPGFWLACVGLGSLAGAVAAALVPGVWAPVVVFSGVSLLSLVALRPVFVAHLRHPTPGVRTNVEALIGKTGIVSERIDPAVDRGRVIVGGEDWRGATVDNAPIEVGSRVLVLRVEGTVLLVERDG
jgi:membrane protein implicated in regulation of membrane protease activity